MKVDHVEGEPDPLWKRTTLAEFRQMQTAALEQSRAEGHRTVDKAIDQLLQRLEVELLAIERDIMTTGGGKIQ